ncbi:MAG TPA: DUF1622 domain-containing protein [Clostridia bacterium]|nr:DUF1622 domain-containing protein [Clostridia bacterium]HQM39867.1 DUF1622 domain-containing protein [Clostridia bacterium]
MIENIFFEIVNYTVLFIEGVGVAILVWTVIKAVIDLFRKNERLRLDLAEGIALALEFKIGGELLRTVVVRQLSELLILGAVILLRAALTFLIHWEINIESKGNLIGKNITKTAKDSEKKKAAL